MRITILIISVVFLTASCNKIKSHRIPGIYHGTLELESTDYIYDENGPQTQVNEHSTKNVDREVVVEDGFAFVKDIEWIKIPLEEFDNSGKASYLAMGGTTTSKISISKDKLSISFMRSYYPGSTDYEVCYSSKFNGTRVD